KLDPFARLLADAAENSGLPPKPGADEIENRNRKAAVDLRRLRQIGDIPEIEIARHDPPRERLEDADDAAKQGRLARTIGTDDGEQRAGRNLAIEVMHRRMAVVAERDITGLQSGRHAHLIASHTMAQRATLTPAAAARRAITVMRRIDQDTACAGCGEAGPWLCAWVWPWTWGCP